MFQIWDFFINLKNWKLFSPVSNNTKSSVTQQSIVFDGQPTYYAEKSEDRLGLYGFKSWDKNSRARLWSICEHKNFKINSEYNW